MELFIRPVNVIDVSDIRLICYLVSILGHENDLYIYGAIY